MLTKWRVIYYKQIHFFINDPSDINQIDIPPKDANAEQNDNQHLVDNNSFTLHPESQIFEPINRAVLPLFDPPTTSEISSKSVAFEHNLDQNEQDNNPLKLLTE